MKNYTVVYNDWCIHVSARDKKQARHKAWEKFNNDFPVPYGNFMCNIHSVEEN